MYRHFLNKRLPFVFLFAVAVVPGLAAGGILLQAWQAAQFPIVDVFRIQSAHEEPDGTLVISGVLRKRFGFCRYVGATWIAETASGVLVRVPWSSVEQRTPGLSPNRPAGLQRFGPWAIEAAGIPAVSFSLVVDHVCGSVWPTRTIIGPFSPDEIGKGRP